jgi:hypothetical protein
VRAGDRSPHGKRERHRQLGHHVSSHGVSPHFTAD